jgi:pimeloyl-ACP methyl ester carboxylesterase
MDTAMSRDAFFDSDGLRLHYFTFGPEGGEPVLFLHGGGLTAHTWDAVLSRLRGGYRCIALDMRGHGESDWTADGRYLLEDYVRDVRVLIARLGIEGCSVVGMSLGGQVALSAAAHGVEFRSLTLVDIGPTADREGGAGIRRFTGTHRYASFAEALDAAAQFNPDRSRESLAASLRRNMIEDADHSWSWKWDPRRYDDLEHRTRQAAALWEAVPRLTLPVLVVRGEQSKVFTAAEHERLVRALPHGSGVVVPRAGHTVQGDNPDDLAAELDRFLGEAVLPTGRHL